MLILDDAFVRRHLDATLAMAAVRDACIALHRGEVQAPPRAIIDLGAGAMFGSMPGALGEGGVYGAKLVSYVPARAAAGAASHHGMVIIFDPETGAPLAGVAAGVLTAMRTAAGSALATDVLSRPGSTTLAILGCGAQAFAHAILMAEVRPLRSIDVWGRTPERARAFADRVARATGVTCRARADIAATVAEADVVCSTTAATTPVLSLSQLRAGTHVNAIGAARGDGELEFDTTVSPCVVVDSRDAVIAEAGDIGAACASGRLDASAMIDLGDMLMDAEGRAALPAAAISVYRSVGHVAQDLACAHALYRRAIDPEFDGDRSA